MTEQPIVIDTRPIVEELHARLSAQITDAIKALEAKASAGWVTPDGGTADAHINRSATFWSQ